jgi:tetratricopeptide (TPR) repeat protein
MSSSAPRAAAVLLAAMFATATTAQAQEPAAPAASDSAPTQDGASTAVGEPERAPDGPTTAASEPAPAPDVSATAASEPTPEATGESESAAAAAARGVVARAKALFAVGDYSAALAEFTRAYELLDGDPRQGALLNNIAVCYERMFRYDRALQYYERYLRAGGAGAEDRAEVEAVMHSLRDLLGTLRITGPSGGEVWIGDRQLGQVPADVLVPAGVYVVEVRAKGYEDARRELRIAARETQHWSVVLQPLPTYRGLSPAYFWTGAALTGAALITGAAFGVAALSKSAEGDDEAARGLAVDPEPTRDLTRKADVAFVAAGVLGAATTLLFFLTDWSDRDASERPQAQASPTVGVAATPHAVALVLGGATP